MFAGAGNEWVTVDAAISSDLYYFDLPGQDWQPIATAPDGSAAQVENRAIGKLRQTFDLGIKTKGTYKIAIVTEMLMGSYMLNGERKMLPRGTTPATLANRSEERRAGKECGSTCRYRGTPFHEKKHKKQT